ncbi:basic amino acid ABC transporter substrate-binding protein [Virgibacillus profundi]|uniref:Basic amino acid ABC transporter substrate-binding protein n=1 Tax=Virgibacillus profundi TaxID=2024555 RepID=A0A2A2IAS7_9BACI|nr:basic amino acid ABC transporter substrate-binding protein [Virgibacillus profundi]PAV28163.1 basic amino acid ABC transporter substrate-binding protein [Virgibacillus profundi]PXY52468.1 basic amino acid ABC transporter substrate-binding protein [Virgibacillus profundi]
MNKVRFWSVGILLLVLSMVLFGCGDSDTASSEDGDSADGKTKLVVGTDATYAPMEYMDEDGNIVGIDIDIVEAIAEAADFEVEFKNIGWEPLFPAVDNEEVDFAVSSITITDERKESFDFTDPYYVANQVILVPEDTDITEYADLEDKRVSVQINTTGHIVVKELLGNTSADIVAAETMPFAIEEMLNENADAAVGDNSVVNEYIKNNPNVELKVIEDDSFEKEFYGLMVKQGNTEVMDLLNEGIQAIKDSGKLKEITGFDVE